MQPTRPKKSTLPKQCIGIITQGEKRGIEGKTSRLEGRLRSTAEGLLQGQCPLGAEQETPV